MLTELNAINSARTQYRAMFKSMARAGVAWNIHRGSCNVVLLQQGAPMDVELPILLRNVHAMGEQTMVNALSQALRSQVQTATYPRIVRGPNIEVARPRNGCPRYAWVQGWIVEYAPDRTSTPERLNDARHLLKHAQQVQA